jgi:hypothetical protein
MVYTSRKSLDKSKNSGFSEDGAPDFDSFWAF